MDKLAIVVPCYNEEENVSDTIQIYNKLSADAHLGTKR